MSVFDHLDNFSKSEFPPGTEEHCHPMLFHNLQQFRVLLGRKIQPTTQKGGWYRLQDTTRTSRHYAVGRKSDAGDVFPEGSIVTAWRVAVSMSVWGGIGIYFDTKWNGVLRPMLHLDMRPLSKQLPSPLWWCRDDDGYTYPINSLTSEKSFFTKLSQAST